VSVPKPDSTATQTRAVNKRNALRSALARAGKLPTLIVVILASLGRP
jgi:hypothetical protein